MKDRLFPFRTLTWFTQLGLCLVFSIACCNCNNCEPESDPDQSTPGAGQPDLVAETPAMTLTGPAERNGATTADKDITLTLEVIAGTVNTADYTLRATTIVSYLNEKYQVKLVNKTRWTSVDSMNGKTLKELVTDEELKSGQKKDINITVDLYLVGSGLTDMWGKSAKFSFEILATDGSVVAGPVNMDWTIATI